MARKEIADETAEKFSIIENDNVAVFHTPISVNIFSVYLNSEIGELKHYRDLIHLLRTSKSSDRFVIYINNFGGYVHSGLDVINAIKACPAYIYVVVTGPVYSMAPLVVLSADQVFLEDDVFMMFHDYSGSTVGKGNEQLAAITYEKKHWDKFFASITNDFLTPTEIKEIENGKDVYLDSKEIKKRLKKIKKLGDETRLEIKVE